MEYSRVSTTGTSMVKQDISYFYLKNLNYDTKKILDYINSLTNKHWLDSGIMRGIRTLNDSHRADGKMWTANSLPTQTGVTYKQAASSLNAAGKIFTDFTECKELNKIMDYFKIGRTFLFAGMILKKTIKNYKIENPLMRHVEFEKNNNIKKTFDIVVPIQGDFAKNPLIATNTVTGEKFKIENNGLAYIVSNEYPLEFSWLEQTYDYRYTFHLRGYTPRTFQMMKEMYYEA